MIDKAIYFLAFISNVDDSILNIDLENNLVIRNAFIRDIAEGRSGILSTYFRETEFMDIHEQMAYLRCIHDGKLYYVTLENQSRLIEQDLEIKPDSLILPPDRSAEFIQRYVINNFRLLRLFKEGNIRIAGWEFFFIEDDEKRTFYYRRPPSIVNSDPYRVSDEELPEIRSFLRDTDFPFQGFLNLAWENFDLSFLTHPPNEYNLSFLLLMICMEILLSPADNVELSNRISRNTGILLSQNRKEGVGIYREMKRLYGQRSGVVHAGRQVSNNDVKQLRQYVRGVIKIFMGLKRPQGEFLTFLESCGFGDQAWRDTKLTNIVIDFFSLQNYFEVIIFFFGAKTNRHTNSSVGGVRAAKEVATGNRYFSGVGSCWCNGCSRVFIPKRTNCRAENH